VLIHGMKKGDLSKFIEEAIQWRAAHRNAQDCGRVSQSDQKSGNQNKRSFLPGAIRP